MPQRNIHVTRYALGERVYICDAELNGRIKEIRLAMGSTEFLVAYFDDDKCRRSEWFTDEELRSLEDKTIPSQGGV